MLKFSLFSKLSHKVRFTEALSVCKYYFSNIAIQGDKNLKIIDPEIYEIVTEEKHRLKSGLQLIASENFCSLAITQIVGSCLTNKYAEGYPGARYYGGCQSVDKIERLAQKRLLKLFRLDPKIWGVNVQPYSGSPANFAVYTSVLQPHERIMGLDLPDGGHLTHGFQTLDKRISATSVYFESMPYKLNIETGLIDYDALEASAILFKPKLIIAGTTAYSRLLDYERYRKICDSIGAVMHADMAHISGLVAADVIPSPFEFADIVSSTTHKSLRGPRAGIIFYRREPRLIPVPAGSKKQSMPNPRLVNLEEKLNNAVFPALQGGPHINAIGGIAVMALEAQSHEFVEYSQQVLKNARSLAEAMIDHKYKVVSGGTDNHLLLVDLRPRGLDGSRVDWVCEQAGITLNKNTVPGDKSAMNPGGLRLGTPAMTTRGFKQAEFKEVARLIDLAANIAVRAKQQTKTLKEFREFVLTEEDIKSQTAQLKHQVAEFVKPFPTPGWKDI